MDVKVSPAVVVVVLVLVAAILVGLYFIVFAKHGAEGASVAVPVSGPGTAANRPPSETSDAKAAPAKAGKVSGEEKPQPAGAAGVTKPADATDAARQAPIKAVPAKAVE